MGQNTSTMVGHQPSARSKYNFSYGFGIAGGVLAGVIAGVLINIGVQTLFARKRKANLIKNIKFEIEYNINHTKKIISKINEMIAACNSGNIKLAYKPLNMSHKISSALAIAYKSGSLYEIMSSDNIADIMKFLDFFSQDSSRIYNGLIVNAIDDGDESKIVKQLISVRSEVESHNKNLTSALSAID